jgi:hypothetical protein
MDKISNKMPKEYKEAWLKALRSGKYKKATGRMKTSQGHCCLGVLQDAIDGKVEIDPEYGDIHYCVPSPYWIKKHSIEWKLNNYLSRAPTLIYKGEHKAIFQINDFTDITFEEIADLIDEQIEGV